jgi:DNA-binding response OmpR family regulator
VLVAEDDPAIRLLLARALNSADYDVLLAEDGPSALALLGKDPPPDLALLDVMMPGFDGFGVVQRMKLLPNAKRVPVIFLTARDAPPDIIHGIQVGARHYITKPFAIKDVLSKVQKVLGT